MQFMIVPSRGILPLRAFCVIMLALLPALALSGSGAAAATTHLATPTRSSTLGQFERAWSGVQGYTARITLFEKEGSKVQRAVYTYTFSKPSQATLHVVSGTSAGDTLKWDGGTTVVASRGSGLLSIIKKKFSLHDPSVTTIRGSSVDQLGFGAILAHAQSIAGTLRPGTIATAGGVATQPLTLIPAVGARDAGYTREVVALSTTTHLPVRVLGYDGQTLVREVDFSQVTLQQTA